MRAVAHVLTWLRECPLASAQQGWSQIKMPSTIHADFFYAHTGQHTQDAGWPVWLFDAVAALPDQPRLVTTTTQAIWGRLFSEAPPAPADTPIPKPGASWSLHGANDDMRRAQARMMCVLDQRHMERSVANTTPLRQALKKM